MPIPFDIEQAIVDSLENDRPSLLACSLVCRSWLPRTRLHLYRRVSVNSKSELQSFCNFLNLNPAIPSLVRTLSTFARIDSTSASVEPHDFALILTTLHPLLPRLRHWQVSYARDPINPRLLSFQLTDAHILAIAQYPLLEQLSLSHQTFATTKDFVALVTAISALRTLQCDNIRCLTHLAEFNNAPLPRMHLARLSVESVGQDIVNFLLVQSGTTLEHLKLQSSDIQSWNDPAFIAALGHLTHLRHLEINLTTSGSFGLRAPLPARSPPSSHAYINAIITLLQSIPSLALQHLRIEFWQDAASFHEPGSPEPATTALALQRLDQHLTTTYSELSSVTFILSSTGPITTRQEEAARWAITLERDLPDLKTRQLLKFASDPDHAHYATSYTRPVTSIAFSVNDHGPGARFASASADATSEQVILTINSPAGHDPVLALTPLQRHFSSHASQCISYTKDGARIAYDDWGWAVQISHAARLGRHYTVKAKRLKGHTKIIRAMDWSPDGALLASGSDDTSILIWTASSPNKQKFLLDDHRAPITFVLFSTDGRWLVSGDTDRVFRAWDMETGSINEHFAGARETQENLRVRAAAFDPVEPARIATGCEDGRVRVWDVSTGEESLTLIHSAHNGPVHIVAFSPDGSQILSASPAAPMLAVCDSHTGQCILSLTGHYNTINAAAFSPDGRYIASASSDYTVRLWDRRSESLIAMFDEHEDKVTHVHFTPDGRIIASGGLDGMVYAHWLW